MKQCPKHKDGMMAYGCLDCANEESHSLKESGSECRCATQMVCRLHATEAQRNCEHDHYDRTQGIHSSWCQKCGLGLPKLKEAPMQQKVWCKHNILISGNKYVLEPPLGGNRAVCEDEMFCPICAAPRPEPQKALRLWEILSASWKTAETEEESFRLEANAALDVIEKIVDSVARPGSVVKVNGSDITPGDIAQIVKNEIRERLEELRAE